MDNAQDCIANAGHTGVNSHDSVIHIVNTRASHAFHGIAQGGASSHLQGLVAGHQEGSEALLGEAPAEISVYHVSRLGSFQEFAQPVVGLLGCKRGLGKPMVYSEAQTISAKSINVLFLFAAVRIKAACCRGEDCDAPH